MTSGLLVPHSWDVFGGPPPLGEPYQWPDDPEGLATEDAAIADLVATAEEAFGEAETLDSEIQDMKAHADLLRRDARLTLAAAEERLAKFGMPGADALRAKFAARIASREEPR